ncbi:acyltransferase [Vibrio cholerae]|nr:acyltransferase [Vibrio cholerae]EGR2515308.1 acyltransferase [Vibrio cholerae]
MSSVPHRKDIQGLRAIAVLAVMAFHSNPTWLPGGFVGVDVFLVISGFLITSILLHKKSNASYSLTETLKYFYVSRFKRIVPAYFFMLIIVALVAAVLFLPTDFNTFRKGLEKAIWFSSNLYFAGFSDYFAPASYEQPLLHTWSLAVEIQFYLLAPFIVLLLPIRLLKWFFVVLLIALTALAEYRLRFLGIEQATYYSLYARLPEFFVGGLAALYVTTVSRARSACLGTLGMLLIVISAITQPLLGPFPGIAALLPVAGSMLLLIQPTQGWVGKLLSCKTLVWLGVLSYSLYLWHWPVLAFLRYYTGAEVLSVKFSLVFILLTLMLSTASYYGIEQIFRSNGVQEKVIYWVILAASVIGLAQIIVKINDRLTPEQLSIEYRRGVDPEISCHGKIVGNCLRGDLSSERELLVLGDSHDNQLNLFFDELGKKLGFKARVITGSSCVTIPGFDYQRIPELAQTECLNQIKDGQFYQSGAEKIILAGSWSYHIKSEDFLNALERYLKATAIQPKQVIILSQIPRFTKNALRAQRFAVIGFDSNLMLDESYIVANERLSNIAEKYSHVTFLSLDSLDVFSEAPFYDGHLIYRDEHHINEIGAKVYAKYALPYFKKLLDER